MSKSTLTDEQACAAITACAWTASSISFLLMALAGLAYFCATGAYLPFLAPIAFTVVSWLFGCSAWAKFVKLFGASLRGTRR